MKQDKNKPKPAGSDRDTKPTSKPTPPPSSKPQFDRDKKSSTPQPPPKGPIQPKR